MEHTIVNIKNVLMQVPALFIVLSGVVSAEVRIPFSVTATCDFTKGENRCEADILDPSSFPPGTNVAVLEQLSVNMLSLDPAEQFNFFFTAHYQGAIYHYALPTNLGNNLEFSSLLRHNEVVHIYHDGCVILFPSCDPLSPVMVTFNFMIGTAPSVLPQSLHIAGYYTLER